MTTIYDNYGKDARVKLKEEYDRDRLERDIGYARRDIADIEKFMYRVHAVYGTQSELEKRTLLGE